MYGKIESFMPQGPEWESDKITLPDAPDETHEYFWRCPIKCAEFLMGNPSFKGHIDYAPKEIFEADGVTRIYNEMATGDLWNTLQVNFISSYIVSKGY
jgi:hypothetical protein